jgi:hypothetical protein
MSSQAPKGSREKAGKTACPSKEASKDWREGKRRTPCPSKEATSNETAAEYNAATGRSAFGLTEGFITDPAALAHIEHSGITRRGPMVKRQG